MWHIYILKCSDGKLYTGSTTDLDRRAKEHNRKKGGGFTRGRLPVKLLYQESYQTRSEAQTREAQIKKWTRKKKLRLIELSSKSWARPQSALINGDLDLLKIANI